MKKVWYFLLGLIIATSAIFGCKKVIKKIFTGLDADVPEIVVTVPFVPVPPGFPVPTDEIAFPAYTQHFNLDSSIRAKTNNVFTADDVTSIKVKQIYFQISNADQQNNFSNFKSARITFSSNTNSTEAAILALDFPDEYADVQTYTAPATTPELAPYLRGSELTYKVYGKLRRYTTKELKMAVQITLRVR